jgi:lipopolysaccharide/colanic/teichoic acid biosynthesis glycosyltransferase
MASIDELPQLFCVLRGDMSLVGPRPALPSEVAQFDEELLRRLEVPPGVTGLWQVEARDIATFDAYRRLDLHYIENWRLSLDVVLLVLTAQVVLSRVVAHLLPRRRSMTIDLRDGAPGPALLD